MACDEYWLRVEGRGYFVRFVSHKPAKYLYGQALNEAYCFPSLADAQRVADQLKAYGRRATVVIRRQPPVAPPRPLPWDWRPQPPEHLKNWVDKILEAGRASGSASDRIRSGYRALARRCHPDVGGATTQMQVLGEAHAWLRENEAAAEMSTDLGMPFESSPFDDDEIPF